MFCPKCGNEADEDARFCGHCAYEFVKEASIIHGDSHESENSKEFSEQKEEAKKVNENGRYVDEEGFVRKPRNYIGILLWGMTNLMSAASWTLLSEFDGLALILWPVFAYLSYLSIKIVSSHDIETWKHNKHIKLWIYLGCLIWPVLGFGMYYILRIKEQKYLAKTHI